MKLNRWIVVPMAAALLLTGCATQQKMTSLHPSDEQAIMDADLAFAEASYKDGAKAWGEAWAEDGLKPGPKGPVVGKAAVTEAMQGLYSDPDTRLQWHPTAAHVSEGGHLGTTWGRYTLTHKDKDGKLVSRNGAYITVWEKQKDGSWKIVYDSGDGD